MATLAQKPGRASSTATFNALQIDRKTLTTPGRTIAIDAITTVSVGTHVEHRPRLLLWLAVAALAAMSYAATQAGIVAPGKLNFVSIALGFIASGLTIYALKPDDQTHYLLISSSDGAVTRFAASDRALLEEARRLLTEKINGGADGATIAINFETGAIDGLGAGKSGQSHATTQGNGAGALAAAARGAPQSARPGQFVRSGAGGASPIAGETYVDFTAMLPAIVEMQRFYARQPNAQHLDHRLSELELLMRSGAQTSGQKTRVRELTKDLGQILQAYQPAVQIFQQISGMAA